ncbi:MAG: hypothetical protein Q8906_05715 [Bacillota bacterium]|nr:hypothetical protein [Bacillota bacterium]
MNVKRIFGFITGYLMAGLFFHSINAYAMGIKLDTTWERLGAVGSGFIMLLIFMAIFKAFFSSSFFHGFLVATGLFLSFDIVVFHWIFHLHRITNGPEANWLEPILVLFGSVLLIYGVKKERKTITSNNPITMKGNMHKNV